LLFPPISIKERVR